MIFINSNVMSMECMVFNNTERTMTMESNGGDKYTLEKGKRASILLPLQVCNNVLKLVVNGFDFETIRKIMAWKSD